MLLCLSIKLNQNSMHQFMRVDCVTKTKQLNENAYTRENIIIKYYVLVYLF